MIITLGGRIGSGKSTVSKMIADKLGYEIISIGGLKRKLAGEMGLTILEFDKIGRENPDKAKEFDLKYEEYQKSFPVESKIILDSKMSFDCQPDAFKVFMTVSDDEGAKRVYEAQRKSDEFGSYEAVFATNKKRHQGQQDTYKKLYNVDIFDESHYTLVIDTTSLTPEQVYETIMKQFTLFINQ